MQSPGAHPITAFKDKLAHGETVYSMTVRVVSSIEIAPLAAAAGYDSLYVDLEHSALSLETVSQISIAAVLAGVAPFVRVPTLDPSLVARVLDSGATGVIAPDVRSASEAETLVRAARCAPMGDRSLLGVMPHLKYQAMPAADQVALINAGTSVVVMIESQEGLGAVDDIAAIDGVDILLVGANDLCAERGVPGQYDDAVVADAYARVQEACNRHGKTLGVGGLASRSDLVRRYVGLGGRYVSLGGDLSFLLSAAKQKRAEFD